MQDVHDLFRLLPGGTVGTLEEPQVDRWKQATLTLRGGRLLRLYASLKTQAGLKTGLYIEEGSYQYYSQVEAGL